MRLRIAVWTPLIAVTALLFLTLAAHAKRVALVIGNNEYRSVSTLLNPVNDATDIGGALSRLGFQVQYVRNGNFDATRLALLEFARVARGSEIALIFYAGHGIEVGGENYLIPVDAELKADIDVDHEAIPLKSIMPLVESASKLGLVIIDACRNNPFVAKIQRTIRTRSVGRGLASVEPTGNVLVAFAAKEGTTAADGDGRNSPFTTSLLKYVESPGLEINFLFRNVRDDVMQATRREQQPFVYGSLSREAIYLKAALPIDLTPAETNHSDELTWSLLKDTNDANALRRFVSQFPQSSFRAEAERRILELEAATVARIPSPPATADVIVWELVKDTRDPEQLKRFLAQFPNTENRSEAEGRLAILHAQAKAAADALAQTAEIPQGTTGEAPDEKGWGLVKDTRDPQQLALFISTFPKSKRRAEAEKRIASLKADAAAADFAAKQAVKAAELENSSELARTIQFELKRVGCYEGAVNGTFGSPAKDALQKFKKHAAVTFSKSDVLSTEVLLAIRRFDTRVCPLVCPVGERPDGDRCLRIVCGTGQIMKDGACIEDSTSRDKSPARRPAQSDAKCFTFNNRKFCE